MAWKNPFAWLGGQIEYGAGKAIDSVGTALGNPFGDAGISETLMKNGGALIDQKDPNSPSFNGYAPYGLNPTPEQQAIIRAIPELSDPTKAPQILASVPQDQIAAVAKQRVGAAQTQTPTGGGGSTGGSGTKAAAVAPDYKFIQGDPNPYNVNDPGQRLAYVQKLAAQGDDWAKSQLDKTEAEFKKALADSEYYQKQQADEIDQNVTDLTKTYGDNSKKLAEDWRIGSAQRGNVFAAMSPNAFQSSQADEQGAANVKQDEGQANLRGTFDTTKGRLATSKQNLIKEYEDYLAETNNKLAENRKQIQDTAAGYKEGAITELAPIDAAQGITNFKERYQAPTYDPNAAAESLDIGKYTPYVNFGTIEGQGGVTQSNPFANLGGKADPTDTYLDYTGNAAKKKKDPELTYLNA